MSGNPISGLLGGIANIFGGGGPSKADIEAAAIEGGALIGGGAFIQIKQALEQVTRTLASDSLEEGQIVV